MSSSRQEQPKVILKPVTSERDVPDLANINEQALEGDPMKQWMILYLGRTEWDSTVEAITGALTDPNYHLVKAVIPDMDDAGNEKIVGFIQWMCGYIHLEGGYNSAQSNCKKDLEPKEVVKDVMDPASELPDELAEESSQATSAEDKGRARRLKKGEAQYLETRNAYIGAIRGKKHVYIRRIMVLPEYHGQGIGKQLLKVVTDSADEQKIVCWLFARPAGEALYAKSGFRVVSLTELDEPEDGFVCPPGKGMMRLPQPKI
ncbi:hypothetical protein PMZ80_000071 [Knufia obscura]|uniref:N-acetyltransferase domain-containing protein n=2 Tax=Knufia TaxID=430999 RepID=A0AAN8ENK4_9EURO|nr:hypothetical protein PMZ80_000071 [Knufia obscura]KAK5948748.1 hypothetical protein OHC33_010171 [Knufia fluminis]